MRHCTEYSILNDMIIATNDALEELDAFDPRNEKDVLLFKKLTKDHDSKIINIIEYVNRHGKTITDFIERE